MLVSTAPTSTTNITGFLTMVRGSSFRNESATALVRIFVAVRDFFRTCEIGSMKTSEGFPCCHQQVFENGPETQGGEKGESSDDDNGGDQQAGEETASHWKGADGFRNDSFSCQASGDSQHRDNHEKAAQQLGNGSACVVPHGIRVQTAEGRPVIPRGRYICIEHLRQPVRSGIRNA